MAQGLPTKVPVFSSSTGNPLPEASATNDIVYWDNTDGNKKWKKLAAPSTTGTFVLGVKDGTLQWLATQSC
jgi:hypothetical protein